MKSSPELTESIGIREPAPTLAFTLHDVRLLLMFADAVAFQEGVNPSFYIPEVEAARESGGTFEKFNVYIEWLSEFKNFAAKKEYESTDLFELVDIFTSEKFV